MVILLLSILALLGVLLLVSAVTGVFVIVIQYVIPIMLGLFIISICWKKLKKWFG